MWSPDPFEASLLSWLVVCRLVDAQLHEIWMQFPHLSAEYTALTDTTMLYFSVHILHVSSVPKVHLWTLEDKYKIAYKYLLNTRCFISGWCKSEYNGWKMDVIWLYILLTCCYQSPGRLLSWRSRHMRILTLIERFKWHCTHTHNLNDRL